MVPYEQTHEVMVSRGTATKLSCWLGFNLEVVWLLPETASLMMAPGGSETLSLYSGMCDYVQTTTTGPLRNPSFILKHIYHIHGQSIYIEHVY